MADEQAALERELLAAHESGEGNALIGLYAAAADKAEASDDIDSAAFFLTHAWIFALERGDERAEALRARLASWGRVD
ncbi:MAG: hypothetical protein F4213_06305 [Boseongicola sp. SB0677_bin_26]|nr:hypothetical protein [Boseongicola sp. SB0665_bin_10]MYG25621.1 hypothetical protein [Boseongicola sp. SB0677_bin_26]